MPNITNDTALRAAINLLRDSAETGRMPSGEQLPADALELHRQAADHLDTLRRGGGQVVADPAGEGREVHVSCFLNDGEAWNLAQFFKRVGFSDFRTNAQDDAEAYGMRDAADRMARALKDAGYAPR
jgi:hypothetical protein